MSALAPAPSASLDDRIGACVTLLLGVVFGLHRIIDPDLFLHVAVGRAILNGSAIGVSDFIDAYPSYWYVEDKWLACVVAAVMDAIGGADGLMVYQLVIAAAVAGGWYLLQRAWGASPAVAVAGVSLALLACGFRLEPRPDTLSHGLVALTAVLVVRDLPFRRMATWTALLLVTWVNLHGYFVNGLLVLLAATVATALGDRELTESSSRTHRLTTSQRLALCGLALAACFVHPQGWHALASPARQLMNLAGNAAFTASIYEFAPSTSLLVGMGVLRWTLLAITLLVAVAGGFVPALRPVSVRQPLALVCALPWLVWPPDGLASVAYSLTFALALMALFEVPHAVRRRCFLPSLLLVGSLLLAGPVVRNLALIPPAALIVLAPAWTAAAAELATAYPRRHGRVVAVAALCGLVSVTAWLRLTDRMSGPVRAPIRTGWGVDRDRYPSAAADFIARERLPGPLLNTFDIGGFLLYRLHPERRVYIAGNTEMYPLSFMEQYRRTVAADRPDVEALHTGGGITTIAVDVITPTIHGLVGQLAASRSWALVFLDRAGAVYLHVDDTTHAIADRLRVDLERRAAALLRDARTDPAFPEWLGGRRLAYPSFALSQFYLAIGRPDLALREAEHLWSQTPSEKVAAALGHSAMASGQLGRVLPVLEEAHARHPDSSALRALLVQGLAYRVDALLARNDRGAARRDLERMRVLDPDACGPYFGLAKVALLDGDEPGARTYLLAGVRKDRTGDCRRRAATDAAVRPLMDRMSGAPAPPDSAPR